MAELPDILDDEPEDFNMRSRLIYASVPLRILSYIIDLMVVMSIGYLLIRIGTLLNLFTEKEFHALVYGKVYYYLLILVIQILYFTVMEASYKGKTVGKFIFGSTVFTENGEKINLSHALIRAFVNAIPVNAITFIIYKHRFLHDVLSKTIVINDKKSML